MIEFKIITSPDKSQQLSYVHYENELTIGNALASMIVDDPNIGPAQIRVTVEGSQAFIENLMPDIEVRLNGKTIDHKSPIKDKDNVTMGKTTINFFRIDNKPPSPPATLLQQSIMQQIAPDTKEYAVVKALEFLAASAGGGNLASSHSGSTTPPSPPGLPPKPPGQSGPPPFKPR